MWIYIIGCIISLVLLFVIYYVLSDKFTYGMLAKITILSIGSWISIVFEIVFILSFIIMAGISYLDDSDFWNKEIFKKK